MIPAYTLLFLNILAYGVEESRLVLTIDSVIEATENASTPISLRGIPSL
jgi:hypothetical protein